MTDVAVAVRRLGLMAIALGGGAIWVAIEHDRRHRDA